MLLKAFERVEELEKDPAVKMPPFKLMTADAHRLPFKENEFDCVVSTFTLEAAYDLD